MIPSEAVIQYELHSDQVTCKNLGGGRAKLRIEKVCCLPPWSRSSNRKACKKCKCSIQRRYSNSNAININRSKLYWRAILLDSTEASDDLCSHPDSIHCCEPVAVPEAVEGSDGIFWTERCSSAVWSKVRANENFRKKKKWRAIFGSGNKARNSRRGEEE